MEIAEYIISFRQLAATFRDLASVDSAASGKEPSETSVWTGITMPSPAGIAKTAAFRVRATVRQAGALLMEVYEAGLLDIPELDELAVQREAGIGSGLFAVPGNIFAILAGGPEFEITCADGEVRTYHREKSDSVLNFQPSPPGSSPRQVTARLAVPAAWNPQQCRAYAELCERVTRRLEAFEGGISESFRRAQQQYDWACSSNEDQAMDEREAYDYLKGCMKRKPELETHIGPLPAFTTWQTYLRKYRQKTGIQKRSRRASRPHGGSIVGREEIE